MFGALVTTALPPVAPPLTGLLEAPAGHVMFGILGATVALGGVIIVLSLLATRERPPRTVVHVVERRGAAEREAA